MKNIRILEDGNRLIVVLEGYEKSAVSALVETLGTAVSPLSHIRPHTGEAQFQLKGTEKEIPVPKTGKEPETPIKPPVFMEQMQAGARQMKETGRLSAAVQAAQAAKPAQTAKSANAAKPAQAAAGQAAGKQQEAGRVTPPEIPEDFMPVPETEPEQGKKQTGSVKEAAQAGTAVAGASFGTASAGTKAPQKPAEFMDSFELRAYIRQADNGKLSALLREKGRFPNAMHLLNADDRTLREYVKELLLTA